MYPLALALQLHIIFLILIMTHPVAFQPTPTTKSPSTCATCPFFEDLNGRDRGFCEVFDKVFRSHNLRTSDCDKEIKSLFQQPKTCTVKVELITSEVKDDGRGYPVPIDSRTVELHVAQPIKALVEMAIAHRKDLQGWQVATFWQSKPVAEFEL